jgi:hypothetical protein
MMASKKANSFYPGESRAGVTAVLKKSLLRRLPKNSKRQSGTHLSEYISA